MKLTGFLIAATLLAAIALRTSPAAPEPTAAKNVFDKTNLVAWCIVPFDANKRGPEARAEMLHRLGITRFAYDWRDKDIPTFDREIAALKKLGIKLQAFWCPCNTLEPAKEKNIGIILDCLSRNDVKTELWVSFNSAAVADLDQPGKVEAAARAIGHIAREAEKIGCSVGLYNHGGWFGDPDNQIAIIQRLKMKNVGIVYNFHHGRHEIDEFEPLLNRMKPHLMALNLNGMKKDGPMILPIGAGDHELDMLRIVRRSGYRGPIGVLDHRAELDAELSLNENLDGLATLLDKMGECEALKTYRTP